MFYLSTGGDVMAATVRTTAGGLETSPPRALFSLDARPPVRLDAYSYDVLPDDRFIVNQRLAEPGTSMITIVLHWTETGG